MKMLTTKQAAIYANVSISTINRWLKSNLNHHCSCGKKQCMIKGRYHKNLISQLEIDTLLTIKDQFLTTSECSKIRNITRPTIINWINRKKNPLPALKFFNDFWVYEGDLRKYISPKFGGKLNPEAKQRRVTCNFCYHYWATVQRGDIRCPKCNKINFGLLLVSIPI